MQLVAAVLSALGGLLILTLGGPEGWPIVVGWLAASVLVGLVWQAMAPSLRLALALVLLPLCILLTWEGGLFFVPSAIALVIASIPARHRAAT
jgi:hypothetical protein